MEAGEVNVQVDEAKLEETRKVIEAEVADYRSRIGPAWADSYLNNFECWLPNGLNRHIEQKLGRMDQRPQHQPELSNLRQSQTYREFFNTVDKTLEVEGFSLEEVKTWQGNKDHWQDMNQRTLREKMLPVYIRLRAMGYTREDLQS